MTGQEFNDWLDTMGWSGSKAGRELGIAPDTITRYRRHGTGSKVYVDLACECLYRRTQDVMKMPWHEKAE